VTLKNKIIFWAPSCSLFPIESELIKMREADYRSLQDEEEKSDLLSQITFGIV
jgi:hypothetical protein